MAEPRISRAEEVKTERRRQRGANQIMGLKLGVSESILDRNNYEYRWLNDNGGRIEQMTTADDWDLVPDPKKEGKPDSDGLGSMISKVVGKGESGQPMRAYLARKPRKFYEEDQRDKSANIKRTMDAIKRGQPQTGEAASLGDKAYVPASGIQITDDRR